MEKFNSIDEILDFAINEEQKAVDFYNQLAEKVTRQEMKDIFHQYSLEEIAHKHKLEAVKAGEKYNLRSKKVIDLKISDYILDIDMDKKEFTYQEALIVAMKKEKLAYKLYIELADFADDEQTKKLFLMLANEEANHKLRFEIDYDKDILSEN